MSEELADSDLGAALARGRRYVQRTVLNWGRIKESRLFYLRAVRIEAGKRLKARM